MEANKCCTFDAESYVLPTGGPPTNFKTLFLKLITLRIMQKVQLSHH